MDGDCRGIVRFLAVDFKGGAQRPSFRPACCTPSTVPRRRRPDSALQVLTHPEPPSSLAAMMLAGLSVPDDAVDELAELVRAAGADDLADRLERAVADGVALLALKIDERSIILHCARGSA
jgi:hypothetical protein